MRVEMIYLKWMDSLAFSDRTVLDVALEARCLPTETCGFLLREDKHSITIGQTIFSFEGDHPQEIDNYIVIPKGWIVERKEY